MKKIFFYACMLIITFLSIETICSAALFYRYRSLGEIPSFHGEPVLSTILIFKRVFAGLKTGKPEIHAASAQTAAAPQPSKYQSLVPLIKDGSSFTSDPYPFFIADRDLGYAAKPGHYVFTYQKKQGDFYTYFKNTVTILPDMTRFSGARPENPDRNVYVFGDSFVMGEGVNDEQTFTYLLQNKFPSYAFHLYAVGGYGTTQAYVNYQKLAPRITSNDIIILAYADFYKKRSVAAPSRLREYGDPRPMIKDVHINHMKASVDDDGQIHISFVPLFCKFNRDYCDRPDPSPEEMAKVTTALINGIVQKTPAKVFLLHMQGPHDDPVLKALPANVTLISATRDDFDSVIQDDILGFDPHPGPYWHYAIANRIAEFLTAFTNRSSSRGGLTNDLIH